MDPKAEKYYGISPYAYVANNPLTFTDPQGDTIRAVNEASGERALSILQNTFNSVSSARSLFSLSSDGITFNPIDMSKYNDIRGTLNEDEQSLFEAYAILINGSETNVIEVLRLGESLSDYGRGHHNNFPKNADGLNIDNGGGRTDQAYFDGTLVRRGNEGHYVAIVENATTKVLYSDKIERPSRAGELMAHEWGHAIGPRQGRNHLDSSIQMGNAYLRAKGANYYREGHSALKDHSPGFNPNKRVRTFGF